MSKYIEAYKRLLTLQGHEYKDFVDGILNVDLDIIGEAISEVEKYNELNARLLEPSDENMAILKEIDEQVGTLSKENRKHKEYISYLKKKIHLLEQSIEAFEEENQILKDGIKALMKLGNYGESIEDYIKDYLTNGVEIETNNKGQIKEMLEVVENE